VVIHSQSSAEQRPSATSPEHDVVDVALAAADSAVAGPRTANAAGRGVTAAVQTLVLETEAVHEFLDRLAHYAADRLSTPEQAVMCGITLVRDRTNATVASSSDRARAMDEVQYSFGDGPCLDAARHRHTNHVPDIDDEIRWPEYRTVIASHGLRSILSVPVPLDADGSSGCAINVYAETAHAFSATDIETTERLAEEAGDAVRIAVRIAHLSDTAAHLRAAMDSRTSIDLAAGIIMAQNRCSQETAVTILKAASSARNLKLRDLAGAVITSITADPTTTHFDQ
jgi:GAF domain-containing protein